MSNQPYMYPRKVLLQSSTDFGCETPPFEHKAIRHWSMLSEEPVKVLTCSVNDDKTLFNALYTSSESEKDPYLNVLPVGSTEFVEKCLQVIKQNTNWHTTTISRKDSIPQGFFLGFYPYPMLTSLSWDCYKTTRITPLSLSSIRTLLDELTITEPQNLFIKPVIPKQFGLTGQLIEINPFKKYRQISGTDCDFKVIKDLFENKVTLVDEPYFYIAKQIPNLSPFEWRAYIVNGTLKGLVRYDQSDLTAPALTQANLAQLNEIIETLGNLKDNNGLLDYSCSYSIDFGLVKNQSTNTNDIVIIELNDGYALGYYAYNEAQITLSKQDYVLLLYSRWTQMVKALLA